MIIFMLPVSKNYKKKSSLLSLLFLIINLSFYFYQKAIWR